MVRLGPIRFGFLLDSVSGRSESIRIGPVDLGSARQDTQAVGVVTTHLVLVFKFCVFSVITCWRGASL